MTVALANVASSDGGTGGSGSARVGFLLGDVNQSRAVSVADLGLVNAQLSQPVTAANYVLDVNVSGTLSLADKGVANAKPDARAGDAMTRQSVVPTSRTM